MSGSISVVIPTRNEQHGIAKTLRAIDEQLSGMNREIIVVDDSDDATPEIVTRIAAELPMVRLVHRAPGERDGLARAVIAGMKRATGDLVGVLDGDGQHPPALIVQLVQLLRHESLDMAMSTRFSRHGKADGLANWSRQLCSRLLRVVPRLLFPRRLAKVTDPLGGCFVIRRSALRFERYRPVGWKIGLEILMFSDIRSYGEVGYDFLSREHDTSKASIRTGMDFLRHIVDLGIRYYWSGERAGCRHQSVEAVPSAMSGRT